MSYKDDGHHPFATQPTTQAKLDLLKVIFKSPTNQAVIAACIDDAYNRHYRNVIADAQKLAEPQNRIHDAQRNARPQS